MDDSGLDALRAKCEDEVGRFYKQGDKETPACYELFKRALEENNPRAFALVYISYEFLVKKWVLQHNHFPLTQQPVEHFVSVAYSNFYFTLRGKSLANFPTVSHLLGYLKACVATAIHQYMRSERKHLLDSAMHEDMRARPVETASELDDLWQRMCALVTDAADQRLMYASFIEERKPGEIARELANDWKTPRDVTVALYRIRRLLRRDPIIRQMAGIADTDD